MHAGNHLMLSFASTAWSTWDPPLDLQEGFDLGTCLMGNQGMGQNPQTIRSAWFAIMDDWQPAGTIARVHYWHGDCENDYLPGNWRNWGFGGQPPVCADGNLGDFVADDYVAQ